MTARTASDTQPSQRAATASGARTALNSGLRRAALLADLGRAVRAARAALGLSQQALAARAGLSPRFVAQLEAGAGNISVAKLAELARGLDTSVGQLLAQAEQGTADGNGLPHGGTARDPDGGAEREPEAVRLRREVAAALEGRPAGELRGLLAQLCGQRPRDADAAQVIALVGLRGAGKSTLGALLARSLGRRFVELDDQIQELTGLAASEIFELHGEDYYRAAELRALEALLTGGEAAVVAVSGGAVAHPELFAALKDRTLLVWVKARPEQHMQRVVSQGDRRPMADRPNAMAELRALLRARTPYYEQAGLVADTARGSPEACVGRLVAQLERLARP